MPLSTTQYGFIIDPMVPFTNDSGTTIRNGYVRVFMAGSSTPVITYKNYDGATNEETIQLDNSGRTAYPVIVSKGNNYKVCVYDAEHSQESPVLTIDNVVPAGANVSATNVVTGLDNVESPEAGWVKSTVSGTDAEVSLDATNVTSEVDTMAKATSASADYMIPLVHKTGSDPDKKITLGNIFKFALDYIVNLATTITSFASGDYFVVGRSAGAVKMSKDSLLTETSQNALAGNVAPTFDPTRTSENPYNAGERVTYEGKTYIFKVPHYGAWVAADAYKAGLQVKQFNPSYFEIGLFDLADSEYASGNYRVRSCIGYSLPMKTGDKIICIDSTNCYFWVEATDSSGTKTYTNTPVVTYTASSDVSVIVLFGFRNTNPITDIEDLLRRFVFVGLSAPNEYVSNLVKKEVVGNRALPAESFIAGLSINLTSGNFSSNSNAAVPRTSVHLKVGDFIQLEAGIHHKFGVWKIYDDGTTPAGVALKNGIIYINKDCECVFEFYVDSGYSLDIDAIASSFRIYSADAATNKFLATLAKNSCDRIQKLEPSLFHFGYSGVSNGVYSAVYSGFNDIVTDYMAYISLKANDVVRVVDSRYKFRVVRAAVGGTPAQGSFSTGFYIVPSDVDCWICIEKIDGTAFSDEELITAPSCIEIISVYPKRSAEIKNSICAAIARKKNFDAHPSKIRLAAHRGETGVAPENTLPAFIAARNNGYDYIETDVQFTSDGVAMILHDETIDRTSNGSGKLYELTYAQVRAYDFGSWKDARFTGVKIPTLEETLLLCKNIGIGIYLEFKPFGPYTFDSTEIETIIKLVEKYGMADNVLYAGRSDIVHALRPKASVVLGGNAIMQPTIVSQALAVKGTNRVEVWGQVSDTFTESVVNELAENDIKLGAWTAAAQNTTDILRAVPKCVETIVTNTIDARGLFTNMTLHGWS